MRAVLFLAVAALGFGQSARDARPLLRSVAEASRSLTTYRVEGHVDQDLKMGLRRRQAEFPFPCGLAIAGSRAD
jgi:hypothetical protein